MSAPPLRRPLRVAAWLAPLLAALLACGCALGAGIEIPSSHTGPDDSPDTGGSEDGGLAGDGDISVDPPVVGPGAGSGGSPCCSGWNLGGVGGVGGSGLGAAGP